MEFLVALTTVVPEGTTDGEVRDRYEREAERIRELAAGGAVLRLWRPPLEPGERGALGLFVADDLAAVRAALETLPLHSWMTIEITPLGVHPNDPALRLPGQSVGGGET
jgi:muconolactone delta-isomerase